MRTTISAIVIFLVLFLDQASKIWVKTHMYYQEEFNVLGNWFRIHFIENEGMAFGLEFGGGVWGKLALTLFRIVAVIMIGFFIRSLIKDKMSKGLIISMSLIMAGALGNIIDSIFYGMIFEASDPGLRNLANLFPAEGYAPILQGRVVDMLYFPLFDGFLPDWVPFWGGQYAIFFRPVFNIADSAITIGVLLILLFQKSFFLKPSTDPSTDPSIENRDDEIGAFESSSESIA